MSLADAGAWLAPTSELEPVSFVGDDGRPLVFAEEEVRPCDARRLREKIQRAERAPWRVGWGRER